MHGYSHELGNIVGEFAARTKVHSVVCWATDSVYETTENDPPQPYWVWNARTDS